MSDPALTQPKILQSRLADDGKTVLEAADSYIKFKSGSIILPEIKKDVAIKFIIIGFFPNTFGSGELIAHEKDKIKYNSLYGEIMSNNIHVGNSIYKIICDGKSRMWYLKMISR